MSRTGIVIAVVRAVLTSGASPVSCRAKPLRESTAREKARPGAAAHPNKPIFHCGTPWSRRSPTTARAVSVYDGDTLTVDAESYPASEGREPSRGFSSGLHRKEQRLNKVPFSRVVVTYL